MILVIIAIVIIAGIMVLYPPSRSFTASDVSVHSPASPWQSIPFRDAVTGENHTVGEFAGRPVIIQAFTIVCPICTRQQQEITSLKKTLGADAFTYIALDIDPAEMDDAIRGHVQRNGFDGIYAVSPVPLTRALLDQFGPEIISPASAPTIIVCRNGTSVKLPSGIKTSGYLKEALDAAC